MDYPKSEQYFIDENHINIEMTQKIKKDPKFLVYLGWLKQNGAIFENVKK